MRNCRRSRRSGGSSEAVPLGNSCVRLCAGGSCGNEGRRTVGNPSCAKTACDTRHVAMNSLVLTRTPYHPAAAMISMCHRMEENAGHSRHLQKEAMSPQLEIVREQIVALLPR